MVIHIRYIVNNVIVINLITDNDNNVITYLQSATCSIPNSTTFTNQRDQITK